jgi:hypothetical protein
VFPVRYETDFSMISVRFNLMSGLPETSGKPFSRTQYSHLMAVLLTTAARMQIIRAAKV